MDIGKFKASRARLVFWIALPPLLIAGGGLSAFALRLQSEWELDRIRALSEALPDLTQTQKLARELRAEFLESDAASIQSEDELISFLQKIAGKGGFTVDSLRVERRVSERNNNMPMLVADVKGSGSFWVIQKFLGDAASGQYLLSGTALQVSKGRDSGNTDLCRAEITFELVLIDPLKTDEEKVGQL